jgi:hypothetical protein
VKTHELEVSMEAAAVLLSLAMHDTETPVAELSGALARISGALAQSRTQLAAGTAGADEAWRANLDGDLSVCIESMQFHDRLIQQLSAVRNLLASVVHAEGTLRAGFGARRWEDLLGMLRERLSVDSRHQLFDLLMRTGVVENDGRYGSEAQEGSVELFD